MKSKTNSKPQTKLLNTKEANFTEELSIHNKDCYNDTFKYLVRRSNTSELFFRGLDKQIPNQLLYNTEEREAYFLNEKKQLFKLKFEPVNVGERTAEEVLRYNLKEKLRKLIIPWDIFYKPDEHFMSSRYNMRLLTDMFVDLFTTLKEKEITIRCGLGMCNILSRYHYDNVIKISDCKINIELDFDLGKYDLVYGGVALIEESNSTKKTEEVKKEEKKKKWFGLF